MLKKVWFMFVLLSVLMVSGCSGKQTEDMEHNVVSEVEISEMDVEEDLKADVSLEADIDEMENSDVSIETELIERTETEEQSGESSNVEASNTEQPTADTTTTEADAEPSTTEAPSESETVTTQPATDDRGNPADGSPILEITFNIPEAEYVGYDADRVARLAVEKCKAAGMIPLPENLDRLLAEGKITQKEYDEYYPYDGCGYYSVFVETNLNLASTISGERLCSEEDCRLHSRNDGIGSRALFLH